MKLIHLSDLHLGKRVNEFSMLEDQRYILREILGIIDEEKPEGVLIAGDVYDKSVPSAEAVALFDEFLARLAARGLQVFVISGNHDSPERIAFGGRLMAGSGVHMAPVYDGKTEKITLADAYGPVNFYLLPFVKPASVRRFFEEEEIAGYTDALRAAVAQMAIDPAERNVLVTHQFVTGAVRSESEEVSVGGSDNVDASVFDGFDYVALGHIHGAQEFRTERTLLRYCGTPLKYSFSELRHEKSVTVVELGAKGDLSVRTVPLVPERDMWEIRDCFAGAIDREKYAGIPQDDYLRIILTDEEDVLDAFARLQAIYPNLMDLKYDNTRTRWESAVTAAEEARSPLALFDDFYEMQNGRRMDEEQSAFVASLIEKIWEEEA
ncbi:MAG: exonuclease SbcCD subunit D [Eubacterium sp.]|nr:exonuclease SbcCD subunit D [Eubacterium sp.]